MLQPQERQPSETAHGYGGPPRIEFFARCAALEDLAFAKATGRHEYAANARRSFTWLFPQRAGAEALLAAQ